MAKKIKTISDAKDLLKQIQAETDPGANDFAWLSQRLFNPSKVVTQPDPLITIQGKTILTQGNYFTISGKPKAGKSAFISGLIAAAITGQNQLGWQVKLPQGRDRIVHMDTEQGEWEYHQAVMMIKKLANMSQVPGSFTSYRLRGIKAELIRQAITHIAEMPGTGLIIIDGLLDVIIDFNDIHECRMITDILRDVTERTLIGIICIIHQGKANNFTIGHLGSFADRYSQSVLEVVKDDKNQISSLQAVYLRSAGKFDPVDIYYNVNENTWQLSPYTAQHTKADPGDIDLEKLWDFAHYLFNAGQDHINYKQVERDAESYLKIRKKEVSQITKQMFENNILVKDGDIYKLNKAPF